jgi:hypothetical protein
MNPCGVRRGRKDHDPDPDDRTAEQVVRHGVSEHGGRGADDRLTTVVDLDDAVAVDGEIARVFEAAEERGSGWPSRLASGCLTTAVFDDEREVLHRAGRDVADHAPHGRTTLRDDNFSVSFATYASGSDETVTHSLKALRSTAKVQICGGRIRACFDAETVGDRATRRYRQSQDQTEHPD